MVSVGKYTSPMDPMRFVTLYQMFHARMSQEIMING